MAGKKIERTKFQVNIGPAGDIDHDEITLGTANTKHAAMKCGDAFVSFDETVVFLNKCVMVDGAKSGALTQNIKFKAEMCALSRKEGGGKRLFLVDTGLKFV